VSMSQKQSDRSVSGSSDEIRLQKDGVYVVGGEGTLIRVAPPILVTAFATSNPNTPRESAFTEIKFENRRGKWKKEIVSASLLTAQSEQLIKLLSERGYLWPANKSTRARIIAALSVVRPRRDIRVTSVPGWCGKSFVLPDESYRPSGPDRKKLLLARHQTVRVGEYRRKGTLDQWKRHIGRKCVHSTRAGLAVAVNFAAPNLGMLGLNSFGFNFSGTTSGGKTLLLRMAASASGLNSNAGPATWDGTPAAFEQRAMGHRDGMMLLDDISHLEGDQKSIAKLVTFRLAGNRAKERAGQYVVAHNLVEEDSRVITLSTSEDPLWGHLNENGPRRVRGQEVRMIDVPACVSEMQDVFDGEHARSKVGKTVERRRRFVENQERLARQYQGEALRAYLAKRVSDKAARANLKKYMKEFIDNAPLRVQQRWLGRIQRLFAVVYASAAQAIDYGVLPWGKKATLGAIRVCMIDAMQQLIANSGSDAESDRGGVQSDQSMLAEFKRRLDDAKFVRLERNRRKKKALVKQLKMADGIIRPTKPGKCECLLFARTMKAWYPQVLVLKRLTSLLRSRKILQNGRRTDTNTRQVLIAELGTKISCYGLRRKRLKSALVEAEPRN
jgi:putative DNA primase/helicase